MTDREKLVELLNEAGQRCGDIECYDGEECEYAGEINGCMAFIADHLIANGVTFATDNNDGGKWIPVTERLPGTEKVLITNGDIVMRGYRRPDGVWKYGTELNAEWENISSWPVTHWMPLPEPPKEGE